MFSTIFLLRRRVQLAAIMLCLFVSTLLLSCSSSGEDASTQEKREQAFQESMTNVVLEGRFSLDGSKELRRERYEIKEVTKIGSDYWLIHARIQYGERDLSVPVPVKILWAGDTPVVTLTDADIPGVGTFTARVVFYRGQYAGVWSSGEHSGEQFGRIIKKDMSPAE